MQYLKNCSDTAQKMKFSIKDFFIKCDQMQKKFLGQMGYEPQNKFTEYNQKFRFWV